MLLRRFFVSLIIKKFNKYSTLIKKVLTNINGGGYNTGNKL